MTQTRVNIFNTMPGLNCSVNKSPDDSLIEQLYIHFGTNSAAVIQVTTCIRNIILQCTGLRSREDDDYLGHVPDLDRIGAHAEHGASAAGREDVSLLPA